MTTAVAAPLRPGSLAQNAAEVTLAAAATLSAALLLTLVVAAGLLGAVLALPAAAAAWLVPPRSVRGSWRAT